MSKSVRTLMASAMAVLALTAAVPAQAEVVEFSESGFITRDMVEVEADTRAVWMALISPSKWWNESHTWSGDAANLTLRPQAGGCFCERIPESVDPERMTLEGSVEHMRVVQSYPERALRLRGALGPLQSEAVNGVLTIVISETEAGTTRIVFEYVVGGYMRYDPPTISQAVDGVMSEQLAGLAKLLGPVVRDEPAVAEPDDASADDPAEEAAQEPEGPVDEELSVEDALDAMAGNRPEGG